MSCGIKKTPVVQPWKLDVFCLSVHRGAVLDLLGVPGYGGGCWGVCTAKKRVVVSSCLTEWLLQSSHAKPCSHNPQPWSDPAFHFWGIQGHPRLSIPSPRDLQGPWAWCSQKCLLIFSSEFLFIFCTLSCQKGEKVVTAFSRAFILILKLLPRILWQILLIYFCVFITSPVSSWG